MSEVTSSAKPCPLSGASLILLWPSIIKLIIYLMQTLSSPDVTLWINVALSAATLSVAAIGVVAGVVAFIGFKAAQGMVRRHAKAHSEKATQAYLKSEQFKIELKVIAGDILKDQIKNQIVVSFTAPGLGQEDAVREMKD